MFLSYAHADRKRALALHDALVAQGLRVWMDDAEIETFESITATIASGLARSRVLLAFYSRAYPQRRACQWELTAAFTAVRRSGGDPRERVLVVNPEPDAEHVDPVDLRDALFAAAPADGDGAAVEALAARVAARVGQAAGVLGSLGVGGEVPWLGAGRSAPSSSSAGRGSCGRWTRRCARPTSA